MNSTRRHIRSLFIFLAILSVGTLLVAPIASANENNCGFLNLYCNIKSVIYSTILEFLYGLSAIIIFALSLSAGLIHSLIELGSGVLSSPIVNTGFKFTLGLANLGFVLAIIYVAFATILRLGGYETKRFLTNLIIAAVLINFSLMIAGIIIDFNNVLGTYFISFVAPPGNTTDLATAMTSALNPQQLLSVDIDTLRNDPGIRDGLFSFGTAFLIFLKSFVVAVVMGILILIVLLGVAIMLLIRYIYLNILLVLMPLVWLFWIVPELSGYIKTWWKAFLRWNFFLPAVTFFIALSIAVWVPLDNALLNTTTANPAVQGASESILQDIGVPGIIQMIVKLGFLYAALMVGNMLGIKGAGIAMTGAQKLKQVATGAVVGGVRGVGRSATRIATAPAKKPVSIRATERLQKSRFKLVRGVGNAVARYAGAIPLEREFKQRKEKLEMLRKSVGNKQFAMRIKGMGIKDRTAALSMLYKDKKLNLIHNLGEYISSAELRQKFDSYGAKKEFVSIEKSFGASHEMVTAAKTGDAAALTAAAQKFHEKMKPEEYRSMQIDAFKPYDKKKPYGGLEETTFDRLRIASIEKIAELNPGAIASILPKMNTKELREFTEMLTRRDLTKKYPSLEKALKRNLARRMFGSGGGRKKQKEDSKPETSGGAETGKTA